MRPSSGPWHWPDGPTLLPHRAPTIPLGMSRGSAGRGGRGRGRGHGSARRRGGGEHPPARNFGPSLLQEQAVGGGSRHAAIADTASDSLGGCQPPRAMRGSGRLGARGPRVECTRVRPEGASSGCDGSLPASDAISVVNDARRVLAGRSGGLTASQLQMLLSALELAGPEFLPSPVRLQVLRQCREGCGDVEAIDSLLGSAVWILQGNRGGVPDSADTAPAGFLVQQALASHGCKGQCRAAAHRAPPPARLPSSSPPPAAPPSILPLQPSGHTAAKVSARRRPPWGPVPPPLKRFRGTGSRDGDPTSTATVTTFAPPTPRGVPSVPPTARAGACRQAPSVPVGPVLPRFLFRIRAERQRELLTADVASLRDGNDM